MDKTTRESNMETWDDVALYRDEVCHKLSSILFGDTMVPNIEYDYILLLGYSILYKEYDLTGFSHKKHHSTGGSFEGYL